MTRSGATILEMVVPEAEMVVVVVDLDPMQEMEGVVVTIGEGEVDFPTIHLIEVALV